VTNYSFFIARNACLLPDSSYITSCGNLGCPSRRPQRYAPTANTSGYRSLHQTLRVHIRHLVLAILTAAPPPSSYITSWVGTPAARKPLTAVKAHLHTLRHGLALLWPVIPSRQLRRPQRHAPTTTADASITNSTGPSTSAILFYLSSWRHRRHILLLPILTAAAYNQFVLFSNHVFLRHSLLYSCNTNVPLPPRHLVFQPVRLKRPEPQA